MQYLNCYKYNKCYKDLLLVLKAQKVYSLLYQCIRYFYAILDKCRKGCRVGKSLEVAQVHFYLIIGKNTIDNDMLL